MKKTLFLAPTAALSHNLDLYEMPSDAYDLLSNYDIYVSNSTGTEWWPAGGSGIYRGTLASANRPTGHYSYIDTTQDSSYFLNVYVQLNSGGMVRYGFAKSGFIYYRSESPVKLN